jgi:hypothetical protein
MTDPVERPGHWYLAVVATVADVVGVAAFVGLSPNKELRLAVAGGLCIVGAVVAGYGLVRLTAFWFSIAGAYESSGYYRQAFLKTSVPLLISIVFGVIILVVAGQSDAVKGPNAPTPSNSMRVTPPAR